MERKQKRWVQNILAFSLFFFVIASFAGSDFTIKKVSAQEGAVITTSEGNFTGIVPCGKSEGPGSEPCTACHAIVGAKNVLDYLTRITVVVAIAIIFGMGILYILSGVSVNLKKTAKEGLKAVFFGLVLMLSAWLIVSTLLRFLASDDIQNGGLAGLRVGQGALGLECSTGSSGNTGILAGGGVLSGGTALSGNGTCSALSGANACSVENLSKTCFASRASRISQMCNKESGGNPAIPSKTDVCGNYGNRSFSGGLFQINIFDHGSRLGSECANLGSKGSCARRNSKGTCVNWTCNIPDTARFDSCMRKTFTAAGNIDIACKISGNGNNLTPWACSANLCGLGSTTSNFCK